MAARALQPGPPAVTRAKVLAVAAIDSLVLVAAFAAWRASAALPQQLLGALAGFVAVALGCVGPTGLACLVFVALVDAGTRRIHTLARQRHAAAEVRPAGGARDPQPPALRCRTVT